MRLGKTLLTSGIQLTLLLLFSCCKGGNGVDPVTPEPVTVPVLSTLDMSQPVSVNAGIMQFYLNLDKSSAQTVSVSYRLTDLTAKSPDDYLATSGTVSISPGKTQAILDVQIKGDPTNLRRNNIKFNLELGNPVACTISTPTVTGTILTEDGTYLPTDNAGYSTPSTYPGYTLLWSDEFSGNNLDLSSWNQEIGNGTGGWGNNELEYYTNSLKNCFLSNGNLIIEARKEAMGGFNYSSSRITTQNKKFFKYGRIDIRAKLPVGKGIWPALWMLGTNIGSVGWPACGEMDIMELIGTYPGRVTSTMHWKSVAGVHLSKGADFSLASADFSRQFHVFSMVWSQDLIKVYVDDSLFLTVTNGDAGPAYPFNAEQFFIFNVAVGGNWPGPPDTSTTFPQRMFVDYVRVFK